MKLVWNKAVKLFPGAVSCPVLWIIPSQGGQNPDCKMLFVPLTVRAFGSVLVWKCQFSKYKIKAFHSSRKKIIIKLMKSIIIMKIQLSHAFPTVCSEKALCCLKQPAHNTSARSVMVC